MAQIAGAPLPARALAKAEVRLAHRMGPLCLDNRKFAAASSASESGQAEGVTTTNIAEPPFRWPSKVMYYFTQAASGKVPKSQF
jgi:hypothetical protein